MRTIVGTLIIANIVAFGFELLFTDYVIGYFALWPIGAFPMSNGETVSLFAPWQLVTYSFLHDPNHYAHIALNLYGLWMFGMEVENRLGMRRFALVYIVSVIVAAVAQLVTIAMSNELVPTMGASGGVFGVLLAYGMLFPHRRLIPIFPPIPMKAWVFVSIYAAIELGNGVFGMNTGVAHFAHLGGALGAFIVLLGMGYKKFRDSTYGY